MKTDNVVIRGAIADQDVMGLTLIAPIKALKDKAALKEFGTSFALLAQSTGADSKKVMSEFSKFTKKNKKEQPNEQWRPLLQMALSLIPAFLQVIYTSTLQNKAKKDNPTFSLGRPF